jgi:hypothetical protein
MASEELADCFRAFEGLEAERARVLAQLADWPSAFVSFRPSPSSWSAAEVLDHIVRSESGAIADVRTGLQSPHILGSEDRPRIAALDSALRSRESFQVPAGAAAIHPDPQTTLPEVASRWELARTDLRLLLEGLTPACACSGVFCHPFAGWMTFREVLDYFSAHLYHHGFQLERLRTSWTEMRT